MHHKALGALALLAAFAWPLSAFAHAHLKTSLPAAKSVVRSAPKEIQLDFTEDLEPKFSSVDVFDPAGDQVGEGPAQLAPGNAHRLIVTLKPLQPGVYTVKWRVTSTDAHKTSGEFTFTVAPSS